MKERRNINRGFKKLRVWQDAVTLYVEASAIFLKFPFMLSRVASNTIDAAHNINRNIAEGYCRRSLREYLNYLNIALGSGGEFHSSCVSFNQAGHLTDEQYSRLDEIHYEVENKLINLIKSLQQKARQGKWDEKF
jgi:four helix bundle protein